MADLIKFVAERAIAYQQGLDDRKVAPTPEAVARLSELNVPLQFWPVDPSVVIAQLDEIGSPATVATTVVAISGSSSADRYLRHRRQTGLSIYGIKMPVWKDCLRFRSHWRRLLRLAS